MDPGTQHRPHAADPHEEAIVPIRPGLAGSAPRAADEPDRRRVPAAWLAGVAGVLLLVAVVGVFVLLPGWVEERAAQPQQAAAAAAPAPAVPAEPALTEAEIAALRDEADGLLADLLTQQQRVTAASAESWGGESWQRYGELSRAGDDAYLAHDYGTAVATYTDALELGDALLERSAEIVRSALDAGERAIEAGNPELALEQFDLVLRIDADDEAARAGRARAERLPDVLEATRAGDALRQQLELAEAAEAYRRALAIDAEWGPAQRALDAVRQAIAANRFETLMSNGMQALADERYDDADRHFRDALAMRPGSAEARDGVLHAEQGLYLDQIALIEARALAFERRELWSQAVDQYEAALETDDGLAFAKVGLERARRRADLDVKLSNLIENPNLLFGSAVLDSARAIVEEATTLVAAEPDGTARLAAQAEQLSGLIELATTPVTVDLRSDGLTEVTVYRVGALGVFESKEVELRPGNYTALGSRRGFRDVRKTFTVLPGRELEPISVICNEPI